MSTSGENQHVSNENNTGSGLQWSFDRLVVLARSGDIEAAGVLLDQYRDYLLLIANEEFDREIRGKAGASDVVQDSMLHAQQHLHDFRGNQESEFRAWLRTILTNDLRQMRRTYAAQKRNVMREVSADGSAPAGFSLLDPCLTPGSDAIARERVVAIESALAELSPDHRQVIQLRNLDGLDFETIGNQMNRTSDASRKLWLRALESLRQKLTAIAPELVENSFSDDQADDRLES